MSKIKANLNFSKIGLAALAAAAVLLPLAVLAQPPGHGGHRGPGGHGGMERHHGAAHGLHHLFQELDLTDAQKDQVKTLFSGAKEDSQEAREAYRDARKALHEAIHAEAFNEAAIRQAAASVATFEANRAVARAELFQEILKVLTPEQRQKLAEIRADRQERFEEWGEEGPGRGRGGRRG
jgi:Spy/CpxP family protein refolding chaperone